MTARIRVAAVQGSGTDKPQWLDEYDVVIVAAGRGMRCVAAAADLRRRSDLLLALSYPDSERSAAHDATEEALESFGFELRAATAEGVLSVVTEALSGFAGSDAIRVAVDVSGFDRMRIGAAVRALASHQGPVIVDFVYSPGQYRKPKGSVAAAISGGVAAWSPYPGSVLEFGLPSAVILGLGYEPHVAVGTIERLDPDLLWTFRPVSFDDRYDRQVQKANQSLESIRPLDGDFRYPLDRCDQVFRQVAEIVAAVKDDHQVIIVPFGPRMFCAACNLVAATRPYEVEVAKITVSAGSTDSADPDGRFSAMRAHMRPLE